MQPINAKESNTDIQGRIHLILNRHQNGHLLFKQDTFEQEEEAVTDDLDVGANVHHDLNNILGLNFQAFFTEVLEAVEHLVDGHDACL